MPSQATSTVSQYLSMIKFSHTVFALPFAFIGFCLAVLHDGQAFHWPTLLLMLLCMVFARSAAMAFNRWLDRKYDALNPRTAQREVPAGKIKANHALLFTIANGVLFMVCTYFINSICFYLSPVALFVILFYSYTKRFTALCHLVLGVGLALAPIGAYLTVTGYFSILPIIFSLIVLTWVAGFDIIYALQDEEFDRSQNLYSMPSVLGKKNALIISALLHLATIILVGYAGILLTKVNWIYWLGAVLFSSLLVYQHTLVKPNDLSKVNLAFVNTNSMGSVLYALFCIASMIFAKQ